jgi:hypothetical protein
MGVSTHPFDSTVVISFWQGSACTGTFRLPVADAARLISTLAFGMSDAIDQESDAADDAPRPPRRTLFRVLRGMFDRFSVRRNTPLRLLK